MVKVFFPKDKLPPLKNKEKTGEKRFADPKKYLFFVYVQWSRDNKGIKTYMKSQRLDNEIDMVCSGLSDIVADPLMRLNSKNIRMAILYELDDAHDISKEFDVAGIVPTRLAHYLNSDPVKRIHFSQEQIDDIVNPAPFIFRALK